VPVHFTPWDEPDEVSSRRSDLPSGPRTLRVAFVNNMPDGAFEDTEHQFIGLLAAAAGERDIVVDGYLLDTLERSPVARGYLPASRIFEDPPDALIVTGTEPKRAELSAEPYWDELAALLRWAQAAVPSVLLSCLAAHAALLALDGVVRSPCPRKRSGVYAQSIDSDHPLSAGMSDLPLPHSRYNEVPIATVERLGYDVVAASAEVGWSVAARDDGGCLIVLAQGHPEYAADTLLREYRRDLRRFVEGVSPTYPVVPDGYFDEEAETALRAFRARIETTLAASGSGEPATSGPSAGGSTGSEPLMDAFPFDQLASGLRWSWRGAAERLITNWLDAVDARARAGVLR
jgi:homoserine O-succinyltransferase/O-acetyltransferase